jgi:hypothetical protein
LTTTAPPAPSVTAIPVVRWISAITARALATTASFVARSPSSVSTNGCAHFVVRKLPSVNSVKANSWT